MYLFELKERLDYLFKELYNNNVSIDDVRDEIEANPSEYPLSKIQPFTYKRTSA